MRITIDEFKYPNEVEIVNKIADEIHKIKEVQDCEIPVYVIPSE